MVIPRTIRTIVLTGFMGAGKSTIGALLAQALGWEFMDVDAAIEARAGKTIAEIFLEQGEAVFRGLEAEAIREHSLRENVVLALGGGALETETTRTFLASHGQTCLVFLNAPLEVLVARCLEQPAATERPVLADREGLLRRFNTRLPYYRDAHLTVSTEGLTQEEVVARILNSVEGRCASEPTTKGAKI
jgi:shikimate kinase